MVARIRNEFPFQRTPLHVLRDELMKGAERIPFNPTIAVEKYQSSGSLPPVCYHHPDILEAEFPRIFYRNHIAIGTTDDAPVPFSYFTQRIGKEPLLAVKDKEGTLRTFLNICRHRANILNANPRGILTDGLIKCGYHGFKYDPKTGDVKKAPRLGKVEGFSPEDYGLKRFGTQIWGPLVFSHMQNQREMKPEEITSERERFLSMIVDISKRTADIDFSSLKWAGLNNQKVYTVNCNWKLYVGNFVDGGNHIEDTHPELAEILDLKNYKTTVFDRSSLQQCPVKDNGKDANVRDGEAMYWWLYPNVMVNVYKSKDPSKHVIDTNIVLPIGPNKCLVIFDFYFGDGYSEAEIANYIKDADHIQQQDIGVCEGVQIGIESNYAESGPYAKPEISEFLFHKLWAQDMNVHTYPEYSI